MMKICKHGHEMPQDRQRCPTCQSISNKKWRQANPKAALAASMAWRDKNPDKHRSYIKKWEQKNSNRLAESKKAWSASNIEKVQESRKRWSAANKTKQAEAITAWKTRNMDKISEQARERRKADPLFRLKGALRSRLYVAYLSKGIKKNTTTMQTIGCDWEDFFAHLVNTALVRYGFWLDTEEYHIDHITPLASARTEEELIALCHYTNLQLLTPPDNLHKGAKLQQ